MRAIFNLAGKELRKKRMTSLLLFVMCLVSMYLICTAVTGAACTVSQQNRFEETIACDMQKVLHLQCSDTKETDSFTKVLTDYRSEISALPGVEGVGRFDLTGMYFSELRSCDDYIRINEEIVDGGKYESHPDIAHLLRSDEKMLSFVEGDLRAYGKVHDGNLPIYASEVFEDSLPIGRMLTDEYTNEVYEVCGYFARGTRWVEENDLIRFPTVSADGWFIAPFSGESEKNIMTQLSCLHNTYVFVSEDADSAYLKKQIAECAKNHGFQASAQLLSDEYSEYQEETKALTSRQMALAVFISAMAVSAVIAVFAGSALLKRRQYGIFLANGWSLKELVLATCAEIAALVFSSALLAWAIRLLLLTRSTDLFRDVLIAAHVQYTLPIVLFVSALLTCIAALILALRIFGYRPAELIGGNEND